MDEHEQSLTREILADAERRAGRARQRAEREAQKMLDDAARQARAQRDRVLLGFLTVLHEQQKDDTTRQ